MGHFSMEIYAPTGSNLSGNQQSADNQIGKAPPLNSINGSDRNLNVCSAFIRILPPSFRQVRQKSGDTPTAHSSYLSEIISKQWWAVQGSNLWPLPCQGSALPLS